MMTPMVNINGTSRDELVQQRRDFLDTLRTAMGTMMAMRPHLRDYPHDRLQYEADRELHDQRFKALYTLKSEIEEEALAIMNS